MATVDNRSTWLGAGKPSERWNRTSAKLEFAGGGPESFLAYPQPDDKVAIDDLDDDDDTLVSSGTETDSEQPLFIVENRHRIRGSIQRRSSGDPRFNKQHHSVFSSDSENSDNSEQSYTTSYSSSSVSSSDSSRDAISNSSDSSSSEFSDSPCSDSSSESDSESGEGGGGAAGGSGERESAAQRPNINAPQPLEARGESAAGGDGGAGGSAEDGEDEDEEDEDVGRRHVASAISRPEAKADPQSSSSRRRSPPQRPPPRDEDEDEEDEGVARRPGLASKVVLAHGSNASGTNGIGTNGLQRRASNDATSDSDGEQGDARGSPSGRRR